MADDTDYFTLLGLPRTYDLADADLEAAFLAKSREVHPDYHTASSAADQTRALEQSAEANQAYATLKSPVKRADYLVKLWGGPSASEQKQMPPEFLEDILEIRMEIEEVKEADDPERHAAIEADLVGRRRDILASVEQLFASLDNPPKPADLIALRQQLNSIKYIDGLLRDLNDAI